MADRSYMILDLESGNSRGSFRDRDLAVQAFQKCVTEIVPSRARDLALVTFDDKGAAISTELAEDIAQLVV